MGISLFLCISDQQFALTARKIQILRVLFLQSQTLGFQAFGTTQSKIVYLSLYLCKLGQRCWICWSTMRQQVGSQLGNCLHFATKRKVLSSYEHALTWLSDSFQSLPKHFRLLSTSGVSRVCSQCRLTPWLCFLFLGARVWTQMSPSWTLVLLSWPGLFWHLNKKECDTLRMLTDRDGF